jgi:threonylcarbamoyladenosine tRNA methylthiotransferase MtaB
MCTTYQKERKLKGKMRTVAYHNLGCKVNSYEMDVMIQNLRDNGFELVPFEDKADIYIVNTCTVTNIADRKSRQMLHRAKKTNPEGIVVAVGCYVQSDREAVEADIAVDLIVGNNRKKDLVQILENYLEGVTDNNLDNVIDINKTREYERMQLLTTQEHTRAYIKIQDGCNQFCTYCMIPFARGRVRSREKYDILEEIKGLCERGYKEFVLTGIHISSYGVDFNDGRDNHLLGLISEIDCIDGVERIRLGSLEPRIITTDFAKGLAGLRHICPHFHLSLQSGSGSVLKRMNRHYTPEEYFKGVEILRNVFEYPAITTDIIVGFPGETEEEFMETYDFAQRIGFYEMHIFKYSKRKGTKAAVMPNQVSEEIKTKRSTLLLDMEAVDSKNYRSYYIGKTQQVLLEELKSINNGSYFVGHTKEYVKVAVPSDFGVLGENMLVEGKVCGFLTDEILLIR